MKNLLDKPYRSGLYICRLLTIHLATVFILLSGQSTQPKVSVELQESTVMTVSNIQVIDVVSDIAVDPLMDQPKSESEVPTATLKTDKVILSRGGSPFKQLSERDKINEYVREVSSKYDMDATLIMSVIQQESEYKPKATNGNCLGLMQVSSYWHRERASKLGVTDFYDPYQNILLGVDYLSELKAKYKDMRLVLMLYNMNHDTAISMYKSGQISNYAKTIIVRAEEYKKGE